MQNNVKLFRTQMKLRQEDLAEHLCVSRQTIISIENGRYAPSLKLAIKIAHVFGKSVEDVFQVDDNEQ